MNQNQMTLMQLKIVADNNALLRVLLANQIKIMDALNLEQNLDDSTYASLSPLAAENPLSPLRSHLKSVEAISELVIQAANDWTNLRGNVSDDTNTDELG